MVFWVFALPVLMAVGLGLAFHTREPELPRIAIVNQGPMGLSQALTTATNLNATLTNEAEARRGLRRAKFDLVVDLGGPYLCSLAIPPRHAPLWHKYAPKTHFNALPGARTRSSSK